MKWKPSITGVLALAAYAAAAGMAVAWCSRALWIVGIICALMCVMSHPAHSHLISSVSLVLLVPVVSGRIEWLSEYIPAFGLVLGLVGTTKMCEESRKPQPVPKWESNGYEERLDEGMVFVGDGDD